MDEKEQKVNLVPPQERVASSPPHRTRMEGTAAVGPKGHGGRRGDRRKRKRTESDQWDQLLSATPPLDPSWVSSSSCDPHRPKTPRKASGDGTERSLILFFFSPSLHTQNRPCRTVTHIAYAESEKALLLTIASLHALYRMFFFCGGHVV